jgi:AraC-like DNA-binding protein
MINLMLKENKQHGSTDFPVNIYEVDFAEGNVQIMACHWHEECEIIFISRGSSVFRIGDKTIDVGQGQILFVNSNELHSSYCDNPSGCGYTALVFNMSLLNSNSYDLIQNRYINPLIYRKNKFNELFPDDNPNKETISLLVLQAIKSLKERREGCELTLKGSLYLILSILIQNNLIVERNEDDTSQKYYKTALTKKILQYISENYSKRIYIDDLAVIANMSRYHFCRFFKKYTGMTPVQYLNFIRVDEASKLLLTGSYSVTEIAMLTGFDNLSYFAKTFKHYKGIAPSDLLKS